MRWFLFLAASSGCHLVFDLGATPDGGPMSDAARGSYAEAVLADEPLAYWRLGTRSVNAAIDETGKGNTGTYEGDAALGTERALAGDDDPAVDFDGDGDAITMGDRLSFEGLEPFTLEAWVRPTAQGNYAGIVSKSDESSGGVDKVGYLMFDQYMNFSCERSDGVATQGVYTGPLTLGRWTYVAATFDGSKLALYVDAVLQDEEATTPVSIPGTSNPFALGARNGGDSLWFTGSIDEVAIYGHALEVTDLERHRQVALGE